MSYRSILLAMQTNYINAVREKVRIILGIYGTAQNEDWKWPIPYIQQHPSSTQICIIITSPFSNLWPAKMSYYYLAFRTMLVKSQSLFSNIVHLLLSTIADLALHTPRQLIAHLKPVPTRLQPYTVTIDTHQWLPLQPQAAQLRNLTIILILPVWFDYHDLHCWNSCTETRLLVLLSK